MHSCNKKKVDCYNLGAQNHLNPMVLVFQYVILIAENDALCILESLSISLMDQTDQQEKY